MDVEKPDRKFIPLVTPRLGDISKQEEGLKLELRFLALASGHIRGVGPGKMDQV